MPKWSYDNWISEQSENIRSAVNRYAMSGTYDAAVYVMPSNGATQGELIVTLNQPYGTCDVVRFPSVGDRVAMVPTPLLASQLWHACRRLPICPTE